jgi:hypothetical protein
MFFRPLRLRLPRSRSHGFIDNPRVTICEVIAREGPWAVEKYAEDTLMVPVTPVSLRITTADGRRRPISSQRSHFWPANTSGRRACSEGGGSWLTRDFAVNI